jgi:hypothetical protein
MIRDYRSRLFWRNGAPLSELWPLLAYLFLFIIVGGLGGAGAPPVTSIAIDHPFLFVIRDITSGAILFTAQVADPTAS